MKKYTLHTHSKQLLSDRITPVNAYLRIRDKYANAFLLESSDYHSKDNSFSYVCFDPIATFKVENESIYTAYPDGSEDNLAITENIDVLEALHTFSNNFTVESTKAKFIQNGLFGYHAYDSVRYYETLHVGDKKIDSRQIPDIFYNAFRYIIAFNHFNSELYLFQHEIDASIESNLDELQNMLFAPNEHIFSFDRKGEETTNFTDDEFLEVLQKGKDHAKRGDTFQMVLSRRYEQEFSGDEFNVYRALRAINPSPYLFYFDFGNYKLFGSSPEAQIVIKEKKATIFPIAGTFKRTGDMVKDRELAKQLENDPKENAEHVMLVDLARNDLSRHGSDVEVEVYREVQYYSHVIHLVSKVNGQVEHKNPLELVGDTFPAGTLSGAPKFRAMQLINEYEKTNRGYYGGCIGYLGFDGTFNQAIMIRSFFSMQNKLSYQAGAGVVYKSDIHSELQEVHNKLGALRKALDLAETI